jgi:hypothetical protein
LGKVCLRVILLEVVGFLCVPSCFGVWSKCVWAPSGILSILVMGGHIVNGCGSYADAYHVVGSPGAVGVCPMLFCYLEDFYLCSIVAALSVLCAIWVWLCAGVTGQYLMGGGCPFVFCA